MRRIGLFLLVGVVLFIDISVASAGVKVIKGYAAGEFAVKESIETQANQLVNELKNDVARKPNTDLQVFIEGFADKSGFSAENDRIAKERAEGIAAVLSREFPKAKIDFVSRGDTIDRRQVIVEWKYILPSTATVIPPAPETKRSMWIILVLIAFALIIVAVLFLFWFHHKVTSAIPKLTAETKWLDVKVDGRRFSVKVDYKDGKIVSPFITRNGFKVTKGQKDIKGMVDSLKGCLRKDEFAEQREILIRCGVILDVTVT